MDATKQLSLDLTNLGMLLKDKMKLAKHEANQVKSLKEEIRGLMIENDLKKFEDKEHDLHMKCVQSFSWDFGMFKLEYPELKKIYFTEETITTTVTNDVYDKKKIKKEYPKEYESCNVELTPRLTVK